MLDISKVMTSRAVGGFHHIMFQLNHCHICRPLLAKAALHNRWLLFYVCMDIYTQVHIFQNSALHSCGEEYCWRVLSERASVCNTSVLFDLFYGTYTFLSFMKTICHTYLPQSHHEDPRGSVLNVWHWAGEVFRDLAHNRTDFRKGPRSGCLRRKA